MYNRYNFFTSYISRAHLYLLLFLTIAMWLTVDFFRVPGILEHPQFTEIISPNYLKELMIDHPSIKISFWVFFGIDFFWAALLLIMLCKYSFGKLCEGKLNSKKWCFRVIVGLAIIAYCLDFVENCYYLYYKEYNEVLVIWKKIAYGLFLFGVILTYLHYTFRKYTQTVGTFLRSSVYSLLILVVLGSFLPKAPQVNSIVVNLYNNPIQLMLLFLAAPIFAVVLAHYPSYFNINEKKRGWFMSEKWRKWLVGIVFYKYDKDFIATKEGEQEDQVNFLLRILGILFYVSLFYMLGYTSEVNFDWTIQVSKLAAILLAVGIIILFELKAQKDEWFKNNASYLKKSFPGFYDGDNPTKLAVDKEDQQDEIPKKSQPEIDCKKKIETEIQGLLEPNTLRTIRKPVFFFVFLFGFMVVFHLMFLIYMALNGDFRYTETKAILSLCCIVLQLVSYVYYRTYRSVLRFIFYRDSSAINNAFYILRDFQLLNEQGVVQEIPTGLKVECKKAYIEAFFTKSKLPIPEIGHINFWRLDQWYLRFLSWAQFGALSNNITFLQATTVVGFINAGFFVAINIFSEWALAVNPIIVILAALFFYYGILIVITKNLIYYNYSKESFAFKKKRRFYFRLVLISMVLFTLNRLGRESSNELFTLPLIERNEGNEVKIEDFVNNLPKNNERYYIGCYGGGMKSNAWTMTILKSLYDQDNDIFKKTAGISGASGGTIGLANIAAIINANSDKLKSWDGIIEDISTENILSLDLTHILGRDTFNHLLIPGINLSGQDRSSKAMERYAYLTNNHNEIKSASSYRAYWKKLYREQKNRFPILISNSTNTIGNGGMAVSVSAEGVAKDILYHDSDDVLEIQKRYYDSVGNFVIDSMKTLGFFDAVSTSNRFPLISPAAKIETKGHFNDGGIYDNSGLLSVLKLYRTVNYIEERNGTRNINQHNVFISIVNDKNLYIKKRLENLKSEITSNKVNKSTEISSILNAVAATEMVPIYVKSELELLSSTYDGGNVSFHSIYLPHLFTVEDVKQMYGEELNLGKEENLNVLHKKLYGLAKKNNSEIKKLINPKGSLYIKPIIQPPMSRVMAKEAFDFMKKMRYHKMTKEVMEKIKNHSKE